MDDGGEWGDARDSHGVYKHLLTTRQADLETFVCCPPGEIRHEKHARAVRGMVNHCIVGDGEVANIANT